MKKYRKLNILLLVLLIGIILTSASQAQQDKWQPERPITIIIPFSPGGGHDTLTRNIVAVAEKYFGVPLIPVNIAGGSSSVAIHKVSESSPDGYTILATSDHTIPMKVLGENIPANIIDDVELVCMFNFWSTPLIGLADSKYSSGEELLEYARNNPGELLISVADSRGINNLNTLLFLHATNTVDAFRMVPYDGGAEEQAALHAGDIDCVLANESWAVPGIRAGYFKAYFNSGQERHDMLDDTPTFIESGYNIELGLTYGIAVPPGTPEEIKKYFEETFSNIARDEELLAMMAKRGDKPDFKSGKLYAEHLKSIFEKAEDLKHLFN